MARVTVEDCIDKVENRFDLVLLASHRARMISSGSQITLRPRQRQEPGRRAARDRGNDGLPGRSQGRPDPLPAEICRGRRTGAGSAADWRWRRRIRRFRRHRSYLRAHDRRRAAQGPRRPGAAGRSAGRGRRIVNLRPLPHKICVTARRLRRAVGFSINQSGKPLRRQRIAVISMVETGAGSVFHADSAAARHENGARALRFTADAEAVADPGAAGTRRCGPHKPSKSRRNPASRR